jgi:hypothetical protein
MGNSSTAVYASGVMDERDSLGGREVNDRTFRSDVTAPFLRLSA